MSTRVKIYTKVTCPYCIMAKNLLKKRGIEFEETVVTQNNFDYSALCKKSGMNTVPQIFLEDQLIGGFDQLNHMDQTQGLDSLK